MPRTLDEMIAALPENERAKIEARAAELIAEEMSLRELRRALGKTQVAVAKRLRIGQDAVSKIEMRGDVYISTLRDYLHAMDGELDLIVRFRDRPAVRLEGLGAAAPRRSKRDRHTATVARAVA